MCKYASKILDVSPDSPELYRHCVVSIQLGAWQDLSVRYRAVFGSNAFIIPILILIPMLVFL